MFLAVSRRFHQEGGVNVKVSESDVVPLWIGTIKHRSLAEHKLLEAHASEVVNLVKGVQSQRWFCRQTLLML